MILMVYTYTWCAVGNLMTSDLLSAFVQ